MVFHFKEKTIYYISSYSPWSIDFFNIKMRSGKLCGKQFARDYIIHDIYITKSNLCSEKKVL